MSAIYTWVYNVQFFQQMEIALCIIMWPMT